MIRKESFHLNDSYGLQLNTSGGDGLNQKASQNSNKIFDLEDEDNMAMADQAADDIEEYFLRVIIQKEVVDDHPTATAEDVALSAVSVDEFEESETDRHLPNDSIANPINL